MCDTWICTGHVGDLKCNFIITDKELQAHKFDLGCPRCGNPFSRFIINTNDETKEDNGE